MANESNEGAACAWQPKKKPSATLNQRFSTGDLPVEPNRYSLVWAYFCPWANPVKMEIDLLGLDKVIASSPIYSLRHTGIDDDWFFGPDEADEDPILEINRVSIAYKKADPNFDSRPTIPALVDVKTGAVVTSQSATLLEELGSEWGDYTAPDAPDLFPAAERDDIIALSKRIADLSKIINGASTAISQEGFNRLSDRFFNELEDFNQRLANQAYLFGEHLTTADLMLFARLLRFDLVWYYTAKLNQHRLQDYPNLWRYARVLYSNPIIKADTDFSKIKQHFYQVTQKITSFDHVIPAGPDMSDWTD